MINCLAFTSWEQKIIKEIVANSAHIIKPKFTTRIISHELGDDKIPVIKNTRNINWNKKKILAVIFRTLLEKNSLRD